MNTINLKTLETIVTTNIKYRATPSQIIINPYNNSLFTLVPVTQHNMNSFQHKHYQKYKNIRKNTMQLSKENSV